MGNTQFNHAVLARVAKSLMRSCGVRTRITCVFHRVNFKWAQCASPQPAPSHLEFALTLFVTSIEKGDGSFRSLPLAAKVVSPWKKNDIAASLSATTSPSVVVALPSTINHCPCNWSKILRRSEASDAETG